MKHIFQTYYTRQSDALNEFLLCKDKLEKLHNAKIDVVKMYRPFFIGDYKVEYKIKENEQK